MAIKTENNHLENRVLVLMPTGRDASLLCSTLEKDGIAAESCANTEELVEKIKLGAGAVLMAEEALNNQSFKCLSEIFNEQPVWSDLPIVLFAGSANSAEALSAAVSTRFNATIVERPIRIPIFISAVRGALRARERQYQSRNLLHQLEEADRQKDLFLATLSHELRTPLNSILGWIQLINNEDSRKHVNLEHALQIIERNARSQLEMISDILFVSRIITGKLKINLQPTDVVPVAETAVDILRPALDAKEIQLNTHFDSDVNQTNGDGDRLQQVFWNLLSNAIKFTPPKGKIDFRVSKKSSNDIEIEVSDSGQGIKPEFLPYVFERFSQADNSYTRQFGGLGLGLAIVHHLVGLHGGTVSVNSPGKNGGATFTIVLPALNAAVSTSNSETLDSAPLDPDDISPSKNISVLLVEDDDDSRELLKMVFEQNQMQTFSVNSAVQALTVLEKLKPDILISDIGLPNEDGYELIGKIRKLPPEKGGLMPAIALTGYANLQDRHRAIDSGFQEHLSKPVEINQLLELVRKMVSHNGFAESK